MNDETDGIYLSTVTDMFVIVGRGCVVTPGIPHPSATVPVLRTGDPLTLRRPDGSELQTSIRSLELIRRLPPVPFIGFLLPADVTKDDVPVGTEVWYFPPVKGDAKNQLG